MKPGRARPPGAPQRVVAVFLALAVVLTQAYRAWAHCTLTVTANPAKVCVGEILTVTQSGVDCQGQSVNVTNTTSFGSAGQQIICPSPACGGCGIDNCATVMVVAVQSVLPASVTLCAGSSNTFSITIAPPGETLPGDPDWTVTPAGAGSIIGSGTSVVFVAANTGVVATVTAGCGSSSAAATVTILTNHWSGWTVSNAPSISLTVSGEVASCAITTVTFTAAISTNNGLRYRSDMNGCAPTNEVSDLVLTNLVTTWNVTGPNAASGSGTQAMFTVSNPGTNMITFTTSGETVNPATNIVASVTVTNVGYRLTVTPTNLTTCVGVTNAFIATGEPGGAFSYDWSPAGAVSNGADGASSTNHYAFPAAGLAQTLGVTYGPCSLVATVDVGSLSLQSVTFSGAPSVFREVLQDNGTVAFASPHWTATNRSPVAYVRNTNLTASAAFAIAPTNFLGTVTIRGTASNGLIFSNQAGAVSGGVVTVPPTVSNGSLPNQVDCITNLVINWEASVDGGQTFCLAGASTNTIYVTWKTPLQATPTHTLLDVGCRAAQGEAGIAGTDDDKVLDKIWTKFQTKAIRRASDNVLLSYYGFFDVNGNGVWDAGVDTDRNNPNTCTVTTSAGLIATGNGQCGAWAQFSNELLKAQGLDGINGAPNRIVAVVIKAAYDAFAVRNWDTAGGEPWKIVSFDAGVSGGSPVTPGNKEAADLVGASGQGNSPNPPSNFINHYICKFNGKYYDPSYALGPITDLRAYEDAALSGSIKQQGAKFRLRLLPPDDSDPNNHTDEINHYLEGDFP